MRNCGDGFKLGFDSLMVVTKKIVESDFPLYEGETEVTPKVGEDQVLETANTLVESDITVKRVQMSKVTNSAGGYTLTVGVEET